MQGYRPGVASLLVAGVLLPGVAMAQQASISPGSQLQVEMERQQVIVIVHPLPNPAAAAQDAGRVTDDLEAAARQDDLLRGVKRRAPSCPDLHYDVFSRIQARNLQRALQR